MQKSGLKNTEIMTLANISDFTIFVHLGHRQSLAQNKTNWMRQAILMDTSNSQIAF